MPLSETRPCELDACPNGCKAADCIWGHWSEWSACDKCGGEKRRFRHVVSMAKCGGAACKPDLAEEVTNCTRMCHQPSYCAFGDWTSWGQCTATCGSGEQHRERHLKLMPATSMQDMVVAFAGGLISLVIGLAVFRTYSRGRQL